MPGIPFLSHGLCVQQPGLSGSHGADQRVPGPETSLIDVVRPELILFEPEPTITKNEIIDELCAFMEAAGGGDGRFPAHCVQAGR